MTSIATQLHSKSCSDVSLLRRAWYFSSLERASSSSSSESCSCSSCVKMTWSDEMSHSASQIVAATTGGIHDVMMSRIRADPLSRQRKG